MDEKPNYYAIIPADVRYDEELKDKAKLLYGEITALTNKTGECYATNKYFATLYKIEPETISRLIKNLKEKGYIDTEIVYKNGTNEIEKRVIKINGNPIVKKIKGYCPNNQEGIDQKVKENNTSINNTSTTTNNISSNLDSSNNLFDLIQKNFGRLLSPFEVEEVKTWKDTELTRYAIKQSILSEKVSIKYISRILEAYKRENIQTVQQAKRREEEFQKNKQKKYHHEKTYEEVKREFLEEEE